MNSYAETFSGRKKLSLTRSEVEERLRQAESGETLESAEKLRSSDLGNVHVRSANSRGADLYAG
jgi:hypothetical protein